MNDLRDAADGPGSRRGAGHRSAPRGRRPMGFALALVIAASGALASCSRDRVAPPESEPVEGTDSGLAPVEVSVDDAGPDGAAVARARRMFAADLGVRPYDVVAESIEEVTWDDSSLGCPSPGEAYTQVRTPGFLIVVTDGQRRARYHAGAQEGEEPRVIRCDKGFDVGSTSFGGAALDMAMADLAARANGGDVEVEDAFVAPVRDLVCPGEADGEASATGPQRVILEFHLATGDETHLYRSWSDEIMHCGTIEGPVGE